MWSDQDVAGQTKIIWKDPKNQGWKSETSYRVYIEHRPKTGTIRLKIYEGSIKIVDSGDVIDTGLSGGRVGVITCSQANSIWSDMKYTCQEDWNIFKIIMYFKNHLFSADAAMYRKYLFLFVCPFKYENTALKRRMLY